MGTVEGMCVCECVVNAPAMQMESGVHYIRWGTMRVMMLHR